MNEEINLEEVAPWITACITLGGAWLRVFMLARKSMWLDETVSVWFAHYSIPDMLQWIVKIDPHPPLYYLLLHSWIGHFGDSPYYARLLSALFGVATIPIIYLIGKRLSGTQIGLAAALFLALSPTHIYFAQETRMYTLLTFNAAIAIYALVRLLTDERSVMPIGSQFKAYLHAGHTERPTEPDPNEDFRYRVDPSTTGWRAWIYHHRWLPIQAIETDLAWIILIIFSAATLLTHNTAAFFSLAINIFVLGLMFFQRFSKSGSSSTLQPPSFANWAKAQIVILLIWSPWLPAFIQQARRVDMAFWLPKPDWNTVIQTLRGFLNPSAPGQISQIMTWLLCAVLVLGLLHYRKKLSTFLFLAFLFFIPVLGELLISIRRPIFYGRTLIWITIPLFLLLAAGITQLRFNFLVVVVMGTLATNYLFSDGDYYRFVQKEDWGTAAGYIARFAEENDLALFNSNFVVIPFDYYFKEFEDLYDSQIERYGLPLDLFDSGTLEPRMTESDIPSLVSMINGHDRVWLVYSHNDYTDPMELIPQTLASKMTLTRQRDFYGGQVQLYEMP